MTTSQWTAFGAQCDDRVSALLASTVSPISSLEAPSAGSSITSEEMATLLFSAGFGGAEVDDDADFVLPELLEPLS